MREPVAVLAAVLVLSAGVAAIAVPCGGNECSGPDALSVTCDGDPNDQLRESERQMKSQRFVERGELWCGQLPHPRSDPLDRD